MTKITAVTRVAFTAAMVLLATGLVAPAQQSASWPVMYFDEQPGVCFYLFQDEAHWQRHVFSVERHATADYVTPPAALEISFPDIDGPAGWMQLDINQTIPREEGRAAIPSGAKGVTFAFKGDGSSGAARIELREYYRAPDSAVEIPLSDDSWRLVTLSWDDFSPAPPLELVHSMAFGLAEGSPRPAHYKIDAVTFVSDTAMRTVPQEAVEAANARTDEPRIPPRPSPASLVYNRGGLSRARARLRKGEPMKWLVYGDSVTVPVQLWPIPPHLRAEYSYYAVAAERLMSEFGSEIDISVNAVGSRRLNRDFEGLLEAIRTERPDVLIMLSNDTVPNYQRLLPRVVRTAEEVGTEILIIVPTYEQAGFASPAFDWLRRWAIENNIACADARRYLLAGDEAYWGDVIANPNHPNPLGHRLIADVVAEMFR